MLDVEIEWNLPELNIDLEKVMKQVAELMKHSIHLNITEGGRPEWPPLKPNIFNRTKAFFPPGELAGSIYSDSGKDWAEAGSGFKWARVHQFGSTHSIPITPKSRGFFWYMFHQTGDEKWKYMALTQRAVFVVHIPARPFVMFQEEDAAKILDMIGSGIINFSDTSGSVAVEL